MNNSNCTGLTAVQCTGSVLMATYSDAGDCQINTTESVMFKLDTPLTVHSKIRTPIPGTWEIIYGSTSSIGIELDGDFFRNVSGSDMFVRVNMQYGWIKPEEPEPSPLPTPIPTETPPAATLPPIPPIPTPTTTPNPNTKSRYMYAIRNNLEYDIVLSNYAASTYTDAQAGYNVFALKKNEFFAPWAWQDSGKDMIIGDVQVDPITHAALPRTYIIVEKIYELEPSPPPTPSPTPTPSPSPTPTPTNTPTPAPTQ